jgi:hypothetical protein
VSRSVGSGRKAGKPYSLVGADGGELLSSVPGTLGGNRRGRIYGRLDCPSALRALDEGGYALHRVFFADERTAVAAGYRPCGSCLRVEYARWKARTSAPVSPAAGQGMQASTTENGKSVGPFAVISST